MDQQRRHRRSTTLGEADEAPNVALLFAKPLDEARPPRRFDPEFVTALAARSPLGDPACTACCSASPTRSPPSAAFRRWGFQSALTDSEVPPTLRRHLPTDRSADPIVRASADATAAATSVAPPGMA